MKFIVLQLYSVKYVSLPRSDWWYKEGYSPTTLRQWSKFHCPAVIGGIQKVIVIRLCISGANFHRLEVIGGMQVIVLLLYSMMYISSPSSD